MRLFTEGTLLSWLLLLDLWYITAADTGDSDTNNIGYWTKETFPDPQIDVGECGRSSLSYVCDPGKILTDRESRDLDSHIAYMRDDTVACDTEGYIVAVAVLPTVIRSRGDDADSSVAVQEFGDYLRKDSWSYGRCGNDVVIVLSLEDGEIYSSVGDLTADSLPPDCIDVITDKAKEKYFSEDRRGDGLIYMVRQYRNVLDGSGGCHATSSPAKLIAIILFIIAAVFFLCCCCFCCCLCCRGDLRPRKNKKPGLWYPIGGAGGGGYRPASEASKDGYKDGVRGQKV